MAGTIFVAPATAILLPTPDPGAVATQIALIRAEDASSSGGSQGKGVSPQNILELAIIAVVLIGLAAGGIFFWRRKPNPSRPPGRSDPEPSTA